MAFAPTRILVPVSVDVEDDPEIASEAVAQAASLAGALGAELILYTAGPNFHPFAAPDVGLGGAGPQYSVMLEILKERTAILHARMKDLAASVDVPASVIVDQDHTGSIAKAICKTIEESGAELVVIPSHGRKGIARALLGSVAERVAHLSPVPVLLLKL